MFFETEENYKTYSEKYELPFLLNSIGTLYDQMDEDRPRGYFCHHVFWVTEGEGIFTFNGETVYIPEGKGIFFKANLPHSYKNSGGKFSTAWVTFRGADGVFDYYGIKDYLVFDCPKELPSMHKTLDEVCCSSRGVFARSSAGYGFLTELLKLCTEPTDSLAKRVNEVLEANYGIDVSLDDIALKLGVGKFMLCRKFKEETGFSVMERLKQIRIEHAKTYLNYTEQKIYEIAAICGFNDPCYFVKTFREVTGETPRRFRHKR
jgi:AraC-like DNA-binding protein